MEISIRWRCGNEEKIENAESLIILGTREGDESPVIFFRGPTNKIVELFAWGAHSWPSMMPFDARTSTVIENILWAAAKEKWGDPVPVAYFYLYPQEILKDARRKTASGTQFDITFEGAHFNIDGIENSLVFVEEGGMKKFGSDGWGSEKKALIFSATERLYGKKFRELLEAAIYGPFTQVAAKMLKSFRAQGREGGITLTPEAWDELAKEKFLGESAEGRREPSNN